MFKVGIYLRLSNDDGDKQESNSVASQRSIILNFIERNGDMVFKKEYVDDGYTGTNFNRPGFEALIRDVEQGIINCIIVKDLSRFGRNYVLTGQYLEQYFPMKGIRFIAINDNYDSFHSTANDDFMMPIRNVFNAHYSKDISRKVKSSLKSKQTSGEFIGAFACYGYMKSPVDRHRLIVDEEAAAIVRRIFKLYIQGYGKISIVNMLNNEHIPCPSEYKKLHGMRYCNNRKMERTNYWTYSTVHNILKNEMYIGNMVQSKSERKTVRGKAVAMNEEQWIKVNNTHEAIIDMETWKITQELLKRRGRQANFEAITGLFAGFIRCGNCGRAMAKVKRGGEIFYLCGTYKWYSSKLCTSHSVKQAVLEELILQKLNEELAKLPDEDFVKSKQTKKQVNTKNLQEKLNQIYLLKKGSYEDYKNGLLTKEEYLSYKEDYLQKESLIHGQMDAVAQELQENDERSEWIENLKKYRKIDKLDRSILACILDGITVYEDEKEKRVEIRFKYVL